MKSTHHSLIVNIRNIENGLAALKTACYLTQKFQARLQIIYTLSNEDKNFFSIPSDTLAVTLSEALISEAKNALDEQSVELKQHLTDLLKVYPLHSYETFEDFFNKNNPRPKVLLNKQVGLESEILELFSYASDLAIFARPVLEKPSPAAMINFHTCCINLKIPSLFISSSEPLIKPIKTAYILFNHSYEIFKSIQEAFPFLDQIENLYVLYNHDKNSSFPLDATLDYLHLYFPNLIAMEIHESFEKTLENLFLCDSPKPNDLIIAGAYTKTTIKRLITGSLTNFLLQNIKQPILFMS